ncbi:hypothetical protein BgiBS90_015156 [Biomphalaria glabrata]|nr:hypothetical protein BgiBS90_015156 [Biomphalaria glabrata]
MVCVSKTLFLANHRAALRLGYEIKLNKQCKTNRTIGLKAEEEKPSCESMSGQSSGRFTTDFWSPDIKTDHAGHLSDH